MKNSIGTNAVTDTSALLITERIKPDNTFVR